MAAAASPATARQPAVGGMLFAYAPHAGERAEFDAGYRAHLEWHRAKRDSLPWYGWDVMAGRRLGHFVDGTFGVPFAALDRRVDPAGDAADAARTFEPHARATERWAVRLRAELGTAAPLEARTPPPLAEVVTYTVLPAMRAAFEAVMARLRRTASDGHFLPYTVYDVVIGGTNAQLMVVVWRDRLGSFDEAGRSPVAAIERALAEERLGEVRVESELWRLRRDLTLLPVMDPGGTDNPDTGPAASRAAPLTAVGLPQAARSGSAGGGAAARVTCCMARAPRTGPATGRHVLDAW